MANVPVSPMLTDGTQSRSGFSGSKRRLRRRKDFHGASAVIALWQNHSAGNTASTPFFFSITTRNFAGFVALALRPTACTSSGPS
jgi:hypothetical protein